MIFDPEGLEAVKALRAAKTMGDLYRANFPLIVAPLQNEELFESYSSKSREATPCYYSQGRWSNKFRKPVRNNPLPRAFREAGQIVACHRAVLDDMNWQISFETTHNHQVGYGMHCDWPVPSILIYTAATGKGTQVVPHHALYEVLKSSNFSGLLNMPVHDVPDILVSPSKAVSTTTDNAYRDELSALFQAMHRISVFIPSNTVGCFTGLTLHKRPSFSGDRNFLHAESKLT